MEDLVSVADDFDPAQYARLPRFDVVAGIALCRQLVSTLYALTPEDAQALRRGTERLQHEVTSLQQVWLDEEQQTAMRQAGFARAAQFSWAQTAASTQTVYGAVMGARAGENSGTRK
jgi:hypothetical protein